MRAVHAGVSEAVEIDPQACVVRGALPVLGLVVELLRDVPKPVLQPVLRKQRRNRLQGRRDLRGGKGLDGPKIAPVLLVAFFDLRFPAFEQLLELLLLALEARPLSLPIELLAPVAVEGLALQAHRRKKRPDLAPRTQKTAREVGASDTPFAGAHEVLAFFEALSSGGRGLEQRFFREVAAADFVALPHLAPRAQNEERVVLVVPHHVWEAAVRHEAGHEVRTVTQRALRVLEAVQDPHLQQAL
mmetsp:Transcript_16249/g.40087  ORF Transcript_16249/g.40087 Transcript_16249/m.40087 type:complete len:244 (-) Transcript_16249:621-1352(-)